MITSKKAALPTLFKLLSFIGVAYAVMVFSKTATDGFTVGKIQHLLRDASDPDRVLPEEILKQLSQKFTYWTKGGQVYAFLSEDGTLVLKCLRAKSSLQNKLKARAKAEQELAAYLIAGSELKEETGLVYLHTEGLTQPLYLTLIDKLQIEHHLDFSRTFFLLQKRAILATDYLTQAMERGDRESAQKAIQDIVQLMQKISQKGIANLDPNLRKNFGFVEGRPIFIDMGRLSKNYQPAEMNAAIKKTGEDFLYWLNQKHPILSPSFKCAFDQLPSG